MNNIMVREENLINMFGIGDFNRAKIAFLFDEDCWSSSKKDSGSKYKLNYEYCSRLILALEENNKVYFEKLDGKRKKVYRERIENYMNARLFSHNKENLSSALLYLRPFSYNYIDETTYNIDKEKYMKVFKFTDIRNKEHIENYYFQVRDKRISILKDAIENYQFPIVIGVGNKDVKKRFFEKYINSESEKVIFETLYFDKKKFYFTQIKLKEKISNIFLLDILGEDRTNFNLSDLKNIFSQYIHNIYLEMNEGKNFIS